MSSAKQVGLVNDLKKQIQTVQSSVVIDKQRDKHIKMLSDKQMHAETIRRTFRKKKDISDIKICKINL